MDDQLLKRIEKIDRYGADPEQYQPDPQAYEDQPFGNVPAYQTGEEIINLHEDGIEQYAQIVNDEIMDARHISSDPFMRERYSDVYLDESRDKVLELQEQYYFRNSARSDAKAARYQNLSQNTGALKTHAAQHSNRSASKRAKKARDASKAYQKVARLQKSYKNDQEKRQSQGSLSRVNDHAESSTQDLKDFSRIEEITRARIAALTYAAQAKSISKEQEEYSIQRGTLQNLLVLQDTFRQISSNILSYVPDPVKSSSEAKKLYEKNRKKIQEKELSLADEIKKTKDKVTRLARSSANNGAQAEEDQEDQIDWFPTP